MKKKKLSGYVMVGALSVGIIGGVGTSAFATTSLETDTVKQTVGSLDATTQEKVQTIKEELKAQLAKLGVTLPERGEKGERFANLDDETKAKAEAIIEKEKAGTITHEEAKAELQELGVTFPEHGGKGKKADIFANLDDETKTKVEVIIEKEKAGTITHEEAKAELQELGVTLPERGEKGDRFANLDDETKAKAEAIVEKEKAGTITHEEAKAQLQELGVTLPEHEGKGKKADIFANLDDETKAKAQELMDNAKAELEELGVKHPGMKNN
jgi:ribonuclease BN (tRNA processing enzyme)